MAVIEPRIPKLIPTEDGGFREETREEERMRRKKEKEEYDKKQIKRIMKNGFSKEQAEYLYKMEKSIRKASRSHITPIY